MRRTTFPTSRWLLVLLIGVGFALRLYLLTAPNLNLDETWSYINSFYIAHPLPNVALTQILLPEPNNALHLVLAGLTLKILDGAFAIRWLSVMVGTVSIALAARIAYRLYGRKAAVITALIVALAYAPVTYAQVARPYALATFLALLSLLLWIEQRGRLNMIVSTLVPLAHIGAMPVIFLQDALTLWRIFQRKPVNKPDWIIRRIPPYAAFLLIVYMVYLRRAAHVMSSGQSAPSPVELISQMLNLIVSGFPALTVTTILFLVGVVLPILVLVIVRWRGLPKNLHIPLLWLIVTYGMLIAGAVLSDGPIKWMHITHVAIALALILSAVSARAPRIVMIGIAGAFILSSASSLVTYYRAPDRYWSDIAESLAPISGDAPIYVQQQTVLWALQVNNPAMSVFQLYPEAESRPAHYFYVEMLGWSPSAPPECSPDPIWQNDHGLRMLDCMSSLNSGSTVSHRVECGRYALSCRSQFRCIRDSGRTGE